MAGQVFRFALVGALLSTVACGGEAPATVGAITGRIRVAGTEQAIGGATVTLTNGETRTVTANEQGWFVLSDLAPTERAVVTVRADGYAEAIEPTSVRAGAIAHLEIGLIQWRATQSFDAATGGVVDDGGGGRATFAAGSLVLENGAPATGELTARIAPLDTDDPELLRAFPGDFSARRTDGSSTLLETILPMAIEVRQGDDLVSLASGMTADVTFPVPADLAGSAPATIGLWSLDPETGAWREEGTATREDDASAPGGVIYRASIGHLSWWNCDRPIEETTCVRGCLRASDDAVVPNAHVQATGVDYRGESDAFSGTDGCFAIDVKLASRVSIVAAAAALVSEPLEVTAPSTPMSVAGGAERCMDVGTIRLDPPLAQVILQWGAAPSDLDSHMTGPDSPRFHVYYGDRGTLAEAPYCYLDTDDTSSFGPEITTLTRAPSGTFRFSVHNYSGQTSFPMEQSGATVLLLVPRQGIARRFDVPTANAAGDDVWRVFDLVSNGQGSFTVAPLGVFASSDAGYDP